METVTGKTCNNCRQFKPVSEYSKGTGKMGLRTFCKKCRSETIMSQRFEQKQVLYEEWFKKGNNRVKYCECGNYYMNTWHCIKMSCGRCEK